MFALFNDLICIFLNANMSHNQHFRDTGMLSSPITFAVLSRGVYPLYTFPICIKMCIKYSNEVDENQQWNELFFVRVHFDFTLSSQLVDLLEIGKLGSCQV